MPHLNLPLRVGSSSGCAIIIVVVPEASFLLFIVIVMLYCYTFAVPKINFVQ